MKISRILSASVLAGVVLLSATACSSSAPEQDSSSPSPGVEASETSDPVVTPTPGQQPTGSAMEVTPSESPTSEIPAAETPEVTADQQAVADTVNGFYSYVSDPANAQIIDSAADPIRGKNSDGTEEELRLVVAALPDGFKYFDTSTPDNIRSAYGQLLMGSSVMSVENIEMNVPASAVTVDGTVATVDTSKVEMTLNGAPSAITSTMEAQPLKLKKNDSGVWVMIPQDLNSAAPAVTTKAELAPEVIENWTLEPGTLLNVA